MYIRIDSDSFFDIHIPNQAIKDIVNTPIMNSATSIYNPIQMDALAERLVEGKLDKKGLPRFSDTQAMKLSLEQPKGELDFDVKILYIEIKNVTSNDLMCDEDWSHIFVSPDDFNCSPIGSLYIIPEDGICTIPKAIKPESGKKDIILCYSILFQFNPSIEGGASYYGRIDPFGVITSGGDGKT